MGDANWLSALPRAWRAQPLVTTRDVHLGAPRRGTPPGRVPDGPLHQRLRDGRGGAASGRPAGFVDVEGSARRSGTRRPKTSPSSPRLYRLPSAPPGCTSPHPPSVLGQRPSPPTLKGLILEGLDLCARKVHPRKPLDTAPADAPRPLNSDSLGGRRRDGPSVRRLRLALLRRHRSLDLTSDLRRRLDSRHTPTHASFPRERRTPVCPTSERAREETLSRDSSRTPNLDPILIMGNFESWATSEGPCGPLQDPGLTCQRCSTSFPCSVDVVSDQKGKRIRFSRTIISFR